MSTVQPVILTPGDALSTPHSDDVMCFGFVTYQPAEDWQQAPHTPDEIAELTLGDQLSIYRQSGMQIIEVEGIQAFSCDDADCVITLWRIEMRRAPEPGTPLPLPWIDRTTRH